MAMACLYLGGKIADSPKPADHILSVCITLISPSQEEAARLKSDPEWKKETKKSIEMAERALLYKLGYRFQWTSAPQAVIEQLNDRLDKSPNSPTLLDAFIPPHVDKDSKKFYFSQTSMFLANQSAKTTLSVQFPPEKIAAACMWMASILLKLQTDHMKTIWNGQPWYCKYNIEGKELSAIAKQITTSVMADAKAAQVAAQEARSVRVEFHHQNAKSTAVNNVSSLPTTVSVPGG